MLSISKKFLGEPNHHGRFASAPTDRFPTLMTAHSSVSA